jgi:Transposase domain (DUF772)/Transposase DDE domain
MFRRHLTPSEPNIFESFENLLPQKKVYELNNKSSWHNLFREHVMFAIDEQPFSELYNITFGRPNAPIRILMSMMILKEGYGWSDAELFEQCRYNILVMNSLGLSNISDEVPTESTYYDLRKKIYEYQTETGEDLTGNMFEQITQAQAKAFSVKADWIRMDSKLVGSDIANCSRLQLVISCLQVFYKSINKKKELLIRIDTQDREELEKMTKQSSGQMVYKMKNNEKEEYLQKLGWMLARLLKKFDEGDSEKYKIIRRLFEEQYNKGSGKIELKQTKEVSSDAIQSPFDEEATYRKKADKKVKGYNVNVTETCNEEGLNLITGVEVEGANYSDNDFLKKAVEQAERVAGKVKEISADGAYNSESNEEFAEGGEKKLHLSGIQGKAGQYELEKQDDGNLKIIDKGSGREFIAVKYRNGKYKIEEDRIKRKYFTEAHIASYNRRKKVEALEKKVRERRCNVEATIFQECYHLRKDKAKYRGKFKMKLWATARAAYVNLVRIKNYIEDLNSNNWEMEFKFA